MRCSAIRGTMSKTSDHESIATAPLWYLLYRGDAPKGGYSTALGGEITAKLASLCGVATDEKSLEAGLATAIDTFLSAKYDEEFHQPEKAENAALDKVARSAQELHLALLDLYEFGRASDKLEIEIQKFDGLSEGSSPKVLSSLLGEKPHTLAMLQNIATDIAVAAEDAINRKPKHDPDRAALWGPDYADELAQETESWRKRSATHKLRSNHAVMAFLEAFKPVWEEHSEHPFTEGMYFTEAKSTASYAVDAMHMVLKKLDPALPRSAVVSGIKNLRR